MILCLGDDARTDHDHFAKLGINGCPFLVTLCVFFKTPFVVITSCHITDLLLPQALTTFDQFFKTRVLGNGLYVKKQDMLQGHHWMIVFYWWCTMEKGKIPAF